MSARRSSRHGRGSGCTSATAGTGGRAAPTCASRAARRSRRRRRGDAVAVNAREQVTDLVPFVHVADVDRSVAYYERLGLVMETEFAPEGRRIWAFLERGDARLMVAEADEPVDPHAQAVLFYLYTRDLDALRARLLDAGVAAGEITAGGPRPRGEEGAGGPRGHRPGG